MEILRVDGLKFSYPNQLKKALNNINFSINLWRIWLWKKYIIKTFKTGT